MKVLQVNTVYGSGSTGKITREIHTALRRNGVDSLVVYGRGTTVREDGVVRLCSNMYGKVNALLARFTGLPYGGCFWSTNKLLNLIKKERPNVVHLQCINGHFVNIYRIIAWLKKKRVPTVLTLHAEFMYTANCSHAFDCEKWRTGCGACPNKYRATKSLFFDRTRISYKKMRRAFQGFEENLLVVSVSPWLLERTKQAPILMNMKHSVIFNGVDTAVFHHSANEELVKRYSVQNRKVVFHATAMFRDSVQDPKGGYYIIELARRMPEVLFLVAGKYEVWTTLPENLVLLDEVRNQEQLAGYYSLADLTVITSKRETFSMVCAESLCCGTPVVGFCAGAPELISLPHYSEFVSFGDTDALEELVRHWLSQKANVTEMLEIEAKKAYAKENMTDRYIELYGRIT